MSKKLTPQDVSLNFPKSDDYEAGFTTNGNFQVFFKNGNELLFTKNNTARFKIKDGKTHIGTISEIIKKYNNYVDKHTSLEKS